MTERVESLRRSSLETKPWLAIERAALLTEFYAHAPAESVPVLRAKAFRHILEHKRLYLGDGELIVGERGPSPQGAPTFPELCCHTLEDFATLHSRPRISFVVDGEAVRTQRDTVMPFWEGRSMRDRIFAEMQPEWKAAYSAGVFTEFMEQRAPGHTVLGHAVYREGLLGLLAKVRQHTDALDFLTDADAYGKLQELRAMAISIEAVIGFANRYAVCAAALAASERDARRRAELERIARNCRRVPAHPPSDFWEALQAYWFIHLAVVTEQNTWDSFSPGRLDQNLYPFYKADLESGALTRDAAAELLECLWVKFNNQPAPPKVGVTAAESGTYTDFAQINLGGVAPSGACGVNDLTWLVLDVVDEMRLLQPSASLQLSKKNPDRFLLRGLEIVRKGWGQPSIFNADLVVQELIRQGKTLEDARRGGTSGCVETGAFGNEAYILTGYFNLPKVLELTLHRGIDPRTGERAGIDTGDPLSFSAFEDLFGAFRRQMRHLIDIKIRGNNVIERLYAENMPAPFLSVLVGDCIARGRDYNAGGARYNSTYIMGVAPGTCTDSLSAIRQHVFESRRLTMRQLLAALRANFEGAEDVRLLLRNRTPRYGNDDETADGLLREVCDAFHDEIEGRPNTRGGAYRVNWLSTTCHVYFGSVTCATPDGRRAGEALSDGISPVQGTDLHGPTAVIRSAARMDHARTGGTLLNQKFTPRLVEGDQGLHNLLHLVRSYFRMDGHHIQFNVVTAATLREAQQNPEKHRDLIVRVAGYSDYFCNLTPALQEEIIARTEQECF